MDGLRGREGRRVEVSAADRQSRVRWSPTASTPAAPVRSPGAPGPAAAWKLAARAAFISWPEGSLGFARDGLRHLPSSLRRAQAGL
jgi:hypothetical protein